jgi:nicotinate dehydrogenase subunit B
MKSEAFDSDYTRERGGPARIDSPKDSPSPDTQEPDALAEFNYYLDLDFTDFAVADNLPVAARGSANELPATGFQPDRRDFLKAVGGGILVLVTLRLPEALAQRGRRGGGQLPTDFNAFLRIGEDGRVSCFTGKIEMGQGIITSFGQMLAEELSVPLEHVDMVMGDTDLCPWDGGTHGSMSTRSFGPPLRAAAAEAKAVLLQLAADELQSPVEQLKAENGVIVHKQQANRRIAYGDLTKGKRIERHLTGKVTTESFQRFTTIGKATVRRDAYDKVTGKAKYAADIRLPGMLCAAILRPPAHGATLKSADTSAAEQVPGVRIVREGDLIAVLHEHPDVAEEALKKVVAQFDMPKPVVDDKTIFDYLLQNAPEGRVGGKGGDLKEGERLASQVVEATYLNPYVAHAPMEPHAAVVQLDGDRATAWVSTQSPFMTKEEVARALNLPSANVRVITPFVGGGFGGKSRNQQAVEAATLAKAVGRPVQVAWARSEEFFYDSYRPAAVVKIRSGVDSAGKMMLWDYHVYFAGDRGAQHFYDIPHHSTTSHGGGFGGGPNVHPFGTGAWRGPGNNTNTHARESHIDLMAAKVGIDPVEFRMKNLKDERMRGVLKAAAEKFAWTPAKAPSGRGFGVACGIDSGTYVAIMAEVAVDRDTGKIQVKRLLCAQDMGLVINPEGAKIQMEGCMTMGLGYALSEELHFKGGDILDRSFGSYQLPLFSSLPELTCVLVDAHDSPAQGGGEPAIIGMGAVLANALFDATGKRLYELPLTPERVKKALAGTA